MMRRIAITDVFLRDGLQDEDVLVPTEQKLRIAHELAAAGVPRIETASFVNPARVPQMADAAEVVAGLANLDIEQTVLALNGKGVRRAAAGGAGDINVVVSASESHSKANAGRGWRDAIEDLATDVQALADEGTPVRIDAGISTAFVCPFEGEIPAERVADIARRFADLGARSLGLADTLGTATTEHVLATVEVVRAAVPELPLGLHLHNADGQAITTAIAAAEIGIDRFDAAVAGFGGCPFAPGAHGNIATEELVAAFHAAGFDTGIDLERLRAVAIDAQRAVADAPALTHTSNSAV